MKKILLFLLPFLIINCEYSDNKKINLIDLVPTNPILLIKYKSASKTKLETFNINFNSLINQKIDSISKRFSDGALLISFHNIGKNNLQSIIFSEKKSFYKKVKVEDSVNYNGFTISKKIIDNIEYFSTIKNDIYIESKSKLLVENSLRNSNHTFTDESGDLKKLNKISNTNTTLFISEKFSNYLNNTKLKEIFKTSNISDWMQFDVEINKNNLTLNGVGILQDSIFKKINILKNTTPSKSNINKIVPVNFKYFKRIAYDHDKYISKIENEISINELKTVISDSILYDVNEIGSIILENDSILTYSFKNNQLLNEKIRNNLNSKYYYRNNEIYEFSKKIFKSENFLINYSPSIKTYGTLIENILILSKNQNSIENIILNYNNNSTIDKSSQFAKVYNNIPENSNQLNVYNLNDFKSSLFNTIKIKQEDYNYWLSHISLDENFIYKTHSIVKTEKEINTLGPKIIFNTKINNGIYFNPKWVTNYVTKKKELVVQDNKNILFLISNNGEVIWEKDLKSKIVGDIFQVDLYKNGRLQYVFNTESSFMVLDKNGNEVKKVNHKKNKKVLGLSVFDYDKNKNYRFLICYDNQIKMLDSKFKIVKGFNKNNIKYNLTNSPKHFRVGSKDYLVINTERKLYVTDRRGNSRIKISEDLNIAGNEVFLNSNTLLTLDNSNNLIKIDLNGKVSKKPLPLDSKYLIFADNNSSIYISENILTINKKNIEMNYGNYSRPTIFLNNLIQISSLDESKIYLFKRDGSMIPYFPIFGTSNADITKNKENKSLLAVTGEKNEILVYSLD